MPVPQSQQITLDMVLRAQDQASAAIKQVGQELASLGKETKIGDLSAGVRESLSAVNAQIRNAGQQRRQEERTQAARSLADLRGNLAQTTTSIKAQLKEDTAAKETAAQADEKRQRDYAQRERIKARANRDEMARDARSFFAQEDQAAKEQLAKRLASYRDDASAQQKMLSEKLRALDAEEAAELHSIEQATQRKVAYLADLPRDALDVDSLIRQAREEQQEQTKALQEGIAARRALLREDGATQITTTRSTLQERLSALKEEQAQELRTIQKTAQEKTRAFDAWAARLSDAELAQPKAQIYAMPGAMGGLPAIQKEQADATAALMERMEREQAVARSTAAAALQDARRARQNERDSARADYEKDLRLRRDNLAQALLQVRTNYQQRETAIQQSLARELNLIEAGTDKQKRALVVAAQTAIDEARRAARDSERVLAKGLQDTLADIEQAGRQQAQEQRSTANAILAESKRQVADQRRTEREAAQQQLAQDRQTRRDQADAARQAAAVARQTAREQVSIARQSARDLAAAQRQTQRDELSRARALAQEQVRLAKELAAQQAAIAKAGGSLGYSLQQVSEPVGRFGSAVGQMRESVERALGPLHGMVETGKQMLVWGVGYQAMYAVTDALGKMVTGLITTNDSFEQTTKTFVAFYGTAAPRVVEWLDRFAAKTPATREEVRAAGLTIAALGDNIGQVMAPLEDLATVMGVDLPKAAQAFSDAQEGRFYMLKRDLHVSKEELVKYGLDLNNVSTTFVGAFTSYVQDRFGGATQRTIGTFAQVVSNVGDNFKNLQRIAGQGIFGALKTQIDTLSKALESPILLSWAHRTGTELGHMAQQAIAWFNRLWLQIGQGPGALAMLQQAVRTAQRVWNGLADVFGFAAGSLRLIVGVIQGAIGVFGFFGGSVRGSTDMLRTMIAVVGDAIIIYKLLGAAIGLGEGALKLWNATVGLATKKLVEQKIATDAQKVSTAELTIATEGQTAKNVLLAESEGSVALATEGVAAKQALATAQTGLLAAGISRVGGVLGFFKGVLLATLGPIGIYIGALAAIVIAIKDVANAYDILVNKMDPSAKKDITAALTPGGTLPTAASDQAGPRGGRMRVPATPGTGNVGALASYLMGVGPVETSGVAKGQTDAYWAYARMLQTGNPDYWIAYLHKHADVEKHYLAMMDKEGKGQAAREILAGTSSLLTKYGGADSAGGATPSLADMLGKQYSQAVEQFNYDVARGPRGKQNTERLQNALIDLKSAHDLMRQSLIESGKKVKEANAAADAWYDQQLSQIPQEFQTAGGYTPGSPTVTGSGGGKQQAAPNFKKQLKEFLANQWAKGLDAIRAGGLDQTDIENLIHTYEDLQQKAGVTVTDTKIRDQIKAATKGFVGKLGTDFRNAFSALQRHVHGVSVDTLNAIIGHIQQVEGAAGLTDTTGAMQLQVARYQQGQQATTSKGAYDELYARFKAEVGLGQYEQAKSQIPELVEDVIRQAYARTGNWTYALREGAAAQTRLTTIIRTAQKPLSDLAEAHSRLTLDLKGLGDSTKDYKTLLGDATRIHKDDLAKTHSKTHAEAAYQQALSQVNAHMTSIARSRLKDDLLSLGTSAADHKRLLDDLNVLYADEKRQYPHSKQAHADYEANLKLINKHMKGETAAGGVQVPTPLYGPYRIATAQYGATQVSFGGTQQSSMADLVQHLKELVSYWQARAHRDEDALRAQQQIAASSKETAVNTANLPERLARVTGSLGLEPAPAGGAGAGLRKRGGFAVIRR